MLRKMKSSESLIYHLPKVRGRYLDSVPLAQTTWFQVGGPAEVTFKPADLEDLRYFLRECPRDIPVHVIGVGSNLLVRDGGVPGVVIRLGRGFTNIFVDGTSMNVGAGVLDRNIAILSSESEIEGFEFLCGVPGTIGGALRMNAGCYGSDMSEILEWALAVDRDGELHKLSVGEMGYSYRHSDIPRDWIFVGARLKGRVGKSDEIQARIDKFLSQREKTQPVKSRTGGSTFANPEGESAWKLIDDAGCRGLEVGGAQMSELHCNFMLNTGGATAKDLEDLGNEVQAKVKAKSGIELRWEIERLGDDPSEVNVDETKRVA